MTFRKAVQWIIYRMQGDGKRESVLCMHSEKERLKVVYDNRMEKGNHICTHADLKLKKTF
uniref:Uncharacterized protein n=1 Tax=Anguilla anguilla TaxID=7936 RepID=A0A0E9SI95_ANGAN